MIRSFIWKTFTKIIMKPINLQKYVSLEKLSFSSEKMEDQVYQKSIITSEKVDFEKKNRQFH